MRSGNCCGANDSDSDSDGGGVVGVMYSQEKLSFMSLDILAGQVVVHRVEEVAQPDIPCLVLEAWGLRLGVLKWAGNVLELCPHNNLNCHSHSRSTAQSCQHKNIAI